MRHMFLSTDRFEHCAWRMMLKDSGKAVPFRQDTELCTTEKQLLRVVHAQHFCVSTTRSWAKIANL